MKDLLAPFAIVIAFFVILGGLEMAHRMANSPAATPSPEFQQAAREAIRAVERLERFSGAIPEFEAAKALDRLSDCADTAKEQNIYNVIANYQHAILMDQLGATTTPDLKQATSDMWAIRASLH